MCLPRVTVFFFPAEDGIRDSSVTGVQTCALPILLSTESAADAVAAALLRPVERLVRRFQHLARRLATGRRADADRDGHRQHFLRRPLGGNAAAPLRAFLRLLRPAGGAHGHAVVLDRAPDGFHRALGLADVAAGKQDAELLAAVAIGDAVAHFRESPADEPQDLVADVVAMRVVELLEVIDV